MQQRESVLTFVRDLKTRTINNTVGDYKKERKEIFSFAFDWVDSMLSGKLVFYSAKHTEYLNRLSEDIVNANPMLKAKPFQLLFCKEGTINAATYFNHIILINIGLLLGCENESQLAFALAHEIAHHYFDHPSRSMENMIRKHYSKDMQAQLRKINNSQYGKREKVESLLKNDAFSFTKRSREQEFEADSLAFVLLKNTRFDPAEGMNLMDILDGSDSVRFDSEKALRTLFDSPEVPFKKRWLRKEEGLLGGHAVLEVDTKLRDSLKTHPDCDLRKARIAKYLAATDTSGKLKNPINKQTFESYQKDFLYEAIHYPYDAEFYSGSFFMSLQILDADPEDAFAIILMGKTLNSIYKAQKNHKLSDYIERPRPWFSKNYNTSLQFIENLHVDDIAGINYRFLKRYEARLSNNPEFQKVFAVASKNVQAQ